MADRIRVQVTAEDIREGTHSCVSCPVAIAIRRATGKPAGVASVGWWLQRTPVRPLPRRVKSWVLRFDAGDPVEPFEFELEVE